MLKLLKNCCYFDIVVDALSHVFQELGIEHSLVSSVDPTDTNNVYLIFTTHHLHETLPHRYISYNFEQLITDRKWPEQFYQRLRGAIQVWDYSLANIKVLEQHAIHAVHLPLGYHACLDRLSPDSWQQPSKRPFKWMHIGALNENRHHKLEKLLQSGRPQERLVTNSCWGDQQALAYRDSLVGMNIHFYTGKTILEVHRIIPLVANGVLVVSEKSHDEWYDHEYAGIVTFVATTGEQRYSSSAQEALCKSVAVATSLPDDRMTKMLMHRRAELIKRCSYRSYVEKALPKLRRALQIMD